MSGLYPSTIVRPPLPCCRIHIQLRLTTATTPSWHSRHSTSPSPSPKVAPGRPNPEPEPYSTTARFPPTLSVHHLHDRVLHHRPPCSLQVCAGTRRRKGRTFSNPCLHWHSHKLRHSLAARQQGVAGAEEYRRRSFTELPGQQPSVCHTFELDDGWTADYTT